MSYHRDKGSAIVEAARTAVVLFRLFGWRRWHDKGDPTEGDLAGTLEEMVERMEEDEDVAVTATSRFQVEKSGDGECKILLELSSWSCR